MEFYVQIMFTLYVVSFVGKAFLIAADRYPKTTTTTTNEAIAGALVGLGFAVWTGLLLWG